MALRGGRREYTPAWGGDRTNEPVFVGSSIQATLSPERDAQGLQAERCHSIVPLSPAPWAADRIAQSPLDEQLCLEAMQRAADGTDARLTRIGAELHLDRPAVAFTSQGEEGEENQLLQGTELQRHVDESTAEARGGLDRFDARLGQLLPTTWIPSDTRLMSRWTMPGRYPYPIEGILCDFVNHMPSREPYPLPSSRPPVWPSRYSKTENQRSRPASLAPS